MSLRVTRGKKTVKRYKARTRQANKTYRIRIPAARLRKAVYKVHITVKRGKRTQRATITGRRL